MARRCQVCAHPRRTAIEKELVTGTPLRSVSKLFRLSVATLQRHKTSHLTAAVTRAAERRAEKAEDDLLEFAIAERRNRVARLQQDWDLLEQVREERAADMSDAPGGSSGLLIRRVKSIGFGEGAREVEEYALDPVMLRERRRIEEQAAVELGQRRDDRGSGQQTFVVVVPTAIVARPVVEIDVPGRMAPALPAAAEDVVDVEFKEPEETVPAAEEAEVVAEVEPTQEQEEFF